MKIKILFLLAVLVVLFSMVACGKANKTDTQPEITTTGVLNEDSTSDVSDNSTTKKSDETTTKKVEKTTVKESTTQSNAPLTVEKTELSYNSDKQIVFYPSDIKNSNKTYPIIAWANGTMCSPDLYEKLLSQIAAGGYIVVANSELMAADGVKQLNSIDFLISENNNKTSVLYHKIDTQNIGVAGHSQGGRSAVNASVADSRVDCVLSLAGSSYNDEAKKLSAPTFFIAGTNDNVVNPSMWVVPAFNNCKGPAVYASLKDAIHTSCSIKPESYSGYAVLWFNAWLKNDAKAKQTFKNGGALSQDSAWTDFNCKGF